MATSTLLPKVGYGVLEMNNVNSRRTGQIKALYPFKKDEFSAAIPAENGMLLVVDEVNGVVQKPSANTDYVYLHASEVKLYNEQKVTLKDFALAPGTVYPRMMRLTLGDTFHTNTVDLGQVAIADAIKGVYAYPGTTGYITLSATQVTAAAVELQIQKVSTMPDGQVGFKFVVTKA